MKIIYYVRHKFNSRETIKLKEKPTYTYLVPTVIYTILSVLALCIFS